MRLAVAAFAIVAAVSSAGAASARQQPPAPPLPPGGGDGMSDMMRQTGMHGGGCLAMSDERLEAVKRDLGVTSAQMPRWNAFADVVRSNAHEMGKMGSMGSMGHMGPGGAAPQHAMTLPQRLDMHERMMTEHLEALRRVKTPLLSFYDSLTPAQKAKADAMCGPR